MPGGKDPGAAAGEESEGSEGPAAVGQGVEDVWAPLVAKSCEGGDGLAWRLLLGYVWCRRWMEVELSLS